VKKPTIKIAVMGPESTGKSRLSEFLSNHYHCPWVPEYAREYCTGLDYVPTLDDELAMLQGQLALEDQIVASSPQMMICDTMFLTIKIWSLHVFGRYPAAVDEELEKRKYDFFLIMNIDLPWQDDSLRDFPHLREHFLSVHLNEIKRLNVPFALISGIGSARETAAIKAVDAFLASHPCNSGDPDYYRHYLRRDI